MLGELLLGGQRGGRVRRLDRDAAQQLVRELVEAGARGARGDEHGHAVAQPLAPGGRGRAAASGVTRSALDSASTRGSAARRGSWAASSCSIVSQLACGSEPSSGARSRTWTSRRVRSTCARKSWPSPAPVAGALDEPRDVGQHELALVGVQRAEPGLERGERVVGDLGRRARQAREQRRLARVGQPHEADVGQQLELQLDPALVARQPALGEAAAPGAWRSRSACCRARRGRRGPARRARPARRGRTRCRPSRPPASPAGRARRGRRRRRRGAARPGRGRRAAPCSAPCA